MFRPYVTHVASDADAKRSDSHGAIHAGRLDTCSLVLFTKMQYCRAPLLNF